MNYIETQTAIFAKKIETRISKLEKEIQRLEKQHDKKWRNGIRGDGGVVHVVKAKGKSTTQQLK